MRQRTVCDAIQIRGSLGVKLLQLFGLRQIQEAVWLIQARRAAIRGRASVAAPAPEIVRDPRSQPLLPLVFQISLHGSSQELLRRNVPELHVQLAQLPRQRGESLVFSVTREGRIYILIRVHILSW